ADTTKILDTNARPAAAGLSTTREAIDLTSAVTKAYGDTSAGAVQHAADLALRTVQLGQTTFPELATSIGKVIPLAAAMGISQENLFAVMATATGVTGSAAEVTTQFRGVLQSLMKPSEDITKLLKGLGFESGKAMVAQMGLQGAIGTIVDVATQTKTPLQNFIQQIEAAPLALALAGPQAAD